MKSSLVRASVTLCASFALAACAGSQTPIGAPSTLSQQPARGLQGQARSWMRPEAAQSKILYVSYAYGNDVFAYKYPGGQYLGMITNIPQAQGMCTSKESGGNWYVVATGSNEVFEFAHGGTTPILTINTMNDLPSNCAVDPTTGNVAVTIPTEPKVIVYKAGSIDGTSYVAPFQPFFAAYDPKGNLYINGSGAMIARLRPGSNTFQQLTLNQGFIFPGGLQWHNGMLAVGDYEVSTVYQFKIRGTNANVQGSTVINGGAAAGFWIQGKKIIAGDSGNIGIWDYPAGGSTVQTIPGNGFYGPIDAMVSLPN